MRPTFNRAKASFDKSFTDEEAAADALLRVGENVCECLTGSDNDGFNDEVTDLLDNPNAAVFFACKLFYRKGERNKRIMNKVSLNINKRS